MPTPTTPTASVRIAAVGDWLLCPAPADRPYPRRTELVSPRIRALLAECPIVFGNLECTLPGDGGQVPTEPRVVARAELVRAVKAAGVQVVTLANNHAFDCLEGGFGAMDRLLEELALPHFGAGRDLAEAARPVVLERGGLRIAFLGAADHRSGTQQFAGPGQWGVAPLDLDRLTRQIAELRSQVDHVLVSLHWGEEHFLIPSPVQVDQAHALIDAGATMILGHHPHVLQGLEHYRKVPIVYSLGNLVADDVWFSDGDVRRWDRTSRTGCILLAELSHEGVHNVRQVPTYDSGELADLEESGFGARRILRTRRAVARGVTLARYRREHLWVKTLQPALGYLRWRRLKTLRLRQIRTALGRLLGARRAE